MMKMSLLQPAFLDLSEAFDSSFHEILLQQLYYLLFTESAMWIIRSFFKNGRKAHFEHVFENSVF